MSSSNRSLWMVCILAILLVAAFGAQFIFQIGRPPSAAKMAPEVIPHTLAGVQTKDLEIAGTESVSKAVKEGLGYSDYRYREYRHGGVEFTVYLAYWQDRKRHFMDLGTHAPDNCWVSNGWTMEPKLPKRAFTVQVARQGAQGNRVSSDSKLGAELPASTRAATGAATWPAEMRVFHANDTTIYVAYWHLLAGHPLDYTRYGTGKTVGYLLDNLPRYWRGTAEQYFLRISSPLPMDQLERDAAFQQVLTSLAAHTPLRAR